ncbi:MAG: pantoate--beta-alanine ligase [Chloroflexi bacterium UTCFX4]|nr:MAG: pantoate--beta-alanine ligase [Chloroflexi bacterium UTCFX4]
MADQRLVTTIAQARARRKQLDGAWGVVPTMGALHAGHLSLVERARAENDHSAVTIFVNPAQFATGGDLDKYPRALERDLALLEPYAVDLVFAPANAEIYPPDFQTYVNVEKIAQPLEGAMRPGHFRGVATVVAKLFNILQPDRAYFGQKDAQQVAVIQQMTRDLNLPVEIVVGATQREPDGLALSSRNVYLAPAERQAAAILYRALCAARDAFQRGERDGENLCATMRATLQTEPRAEVEYVSAADPRTLQELNAFQGEVLLSMAVRIGATRLIDNFLLRE